RRQSTRQAVRQQAERRVPLCAVVARHLHARWLDSRVRRVPREPASPLGMQRTTLQSCRLPALLGNVLLAGERRCVAQLHWPRTRTAATVAGPSYLGVTKDERNARRREAFPSSPSQGKLPATITTLPHRFRHLLEEKIREKAIADHDGGS